MQRRVSRQPDRVEDLHDVENMLFQVARMSHQLDIVRDATQLREDKLELVCIASDLSAVVERALAHLTGPGARVNFELILQERPLVGTVDAERLSHAVLALTTNAIRFSADNAPVRVIVSRRGKCGCVEIEDNGIGVPPDERELIFVLGVRGSNAQRSGGAGLGLFVAREIVRRHRGAIRVQARPEGGSIFELTVPLNVSHD
jgi:signal transduction histidine kinase